MSLPWMPLNVGDYLKDTRHLSAAEHGAYLLLIMEYWTAGELPVDDSRLARIVNMSPAEWKRARPTIAAFFKPGWKHGRVEEERAKAEVVSTKRMMAAQKRWGTHTPKGRPPRKQLTYKPPAIDDASSMQMHKQEHDQKHTHTHSIITTTSSLAARRAFDDVVEALRRITNRSTPGIKPRVEAWLRAYPDREEHVFSVIQGLCDEGPSDALRAYQIIEKRLSEPPGHEAAA